MPLLKILYLICRRDFLLVNTSTVWWRDNPPTTLHWVVTLLSRRRHRCRRWHHHGHPCRRPSRRRHHRCPSRHHHRPLCRHRPPPSSLPLSSYPVARSAVAIVGRRHRRCHRPRHRRCRRILLRRCPSRHRHHRRRPSFHHHHHLRINTGTPHFSLGIRMSVWGSPNQNREPQIEMGMRITKNPQTDSGIPKPKWGSTQPHTKMGIPKSVWGLFSH